MARFQEGLGSPPPPFLLVSSKTCQLVLLMRRRRNIRKTKMKSSRNEEGRRLAVVAGAAPPRASMRKQRKTKGWNKKMRRGAAAITTTNRRASSSPPPSNLAPKLSVYDKAFSSYQALRGHKASHRKLSVAADDLATHTVDVDAVLIEEMENLLDVVETLVVEKDLRVTWSLLELPVWGSPRDLVAALANGGEEDDSD
ncbi:Zinc finger protein ZAT6 [Acorus calamus]|uniref:Zinc finger protein ZAT6 n=1 Tax=Acorus calamus TaxID=4465 RepID=A0AAV9E5Z8_ACOCL|nr:Zinc finger protein ZAT6 [Acorus calamus]